jgi:hypothetical protein
VSRPQDRHPDQRRPAGQRFDRPPLPFARGIVGFGARPPPPPLRCARWPSPPGPRPPGWEVSPRPPAFRSAGSAAGRPRLHREALRDDQDARRSSPRRPGLRRVPGRRVPGRAAASVGAPTARPLPASSLTRARASRPPSRSSTASATLGAGPLRFICPKTHIRASGGRSIKEGCPVAQGQAGSFAAKGRSAAPGSPAPHAAGAGPERTGGRGGGRP